MRLLKFTKKMPGIAVLRGYSHVLIGVKTDGSAADKASAG